MSYTIAPQGRRITGYYLVPLHTRQQEKFADVWLNDREVDYLRERKCVSIAFLTMSTMPFVVTEAEQPVPNMDCKTITLYRDYHPEDYRPTMVCVDTTDLEFVRKWIEQRDRERWAEFWSK